VNKLLLVAAVLVSSGIACNLGSKSVEVESSPPEISEVVKSAPIEMSASLEVPKYTPFPSDTPLPTYTTGPTDTPLPSNTTAPTDTPIPSATLAPPTVASGPELEIVDIFFDGTKGTNEPDEYVQFRNISADQLDLAGYTLRDNADHIYTFPSFIMGAGQECRVYTNEIHQDWCALTYSRTSSAIWNNDGDCAYLRDPEGNPVAEKCY